MNCEEFGLVVGGYAPNHKPDHLQPVCEEFGLVVGGYAPNHKPDHLQPV
jgi:hypothetical protein